MKIMKQAEAYLQLSVSQNKCNLHCASNRCIVRFPCNSTADQA